MMPARDRAPEALPGAPTPSARLTTAGSPEAQLTLNALLATGMPWGQALPQIAEVHGAEAAVPMLTAALEGLAGDAVVDILDVMAAGNPRLAQLGLLAWGCNRRVQGHLGLTERAWVTALPENLTVEGSLFLSKSPIRALPEDLTVGGGLSLAYAAIASLPASLKVGGKLSLMRSAIQTLPDNLSVGGDLDLSESGIQTLPAGLKVKGCLWVDGTALTALPDDLQVQGDVDLCHSRIRSLPNGLRIGGGLTVIHGELENLPPNFRVGGSLELGDLPIWVLPEGLWVGDNLRVLACPQWDGRIPASAYVCGKIRVDATERSHPEGMDLNEWRRRHREAGADAD
jgi:hypothetical protein